MYDITSSCADDFINHEEILDTLAYADQNKENSTLIDSIIQKAKKRKANNKKEFITQFNLRLDEQVIYDQTIYDVRLKFVLLNNRAYAGIYDTKSNRTS